MLHITHTGLLMTVISAVRASTACRHTILDISPLLQDAGSAIVDDSFLRCLFPFLLTYYSGHSLLSGSSLCTMKTPS